MLARTDPCHRIQSINGLNTAGGKTPWNLLTCRSVHLDESSGFCAGDRTKWWLQQAARIIKSTLQTRVSSPNVNQFKSKQQYWLAMKKRAWLLQMLSYIFTGLSFHVSTLACVQINFFFFFFVFSNRQPLLCHLQLLLSTKGNWLSPWSLSHLKSKQLRKPKVKKKSGCFYLWLCFKFLSSSVLPFRQKSQGGGRRRAACPNKGGKEFDGNEVRRHIG